jgi:hypothetical protein
MAAQLHRLAIRTAAGVDVDAGLGRRRVARAGRGRALALHQRAQGAPHCRPHLAERGRGARRVGSGAATDGEGHALDLGRGHRHLHFQAVQVDVPRMGRRLGREHHAIWRVGTAVVAPVVSGIAGRQAGGAGDDQCGKELFSHPPMVAGQVPRRYRGPAFSAAAGRAGSRSLRTYGYR